MEGNFIKVSFCLLFLAFLLPFSSKAQLDPEENRILFEVQKQLEYPQLLNGWNNWTSFCYLPPNPSVVIGCSANYITELTFIGNRTGPNSNNTLSENFSLDSFFTVLTNLSSLNKLTLVSMGLWGQLPPKINTFWSLQVLNISSNFIYGGIPSSISTIKNLTTLDLSNNLLNGSVPDLKGLQNLQFLDLGTNHLGPEYPASSYNLLSLSLKNNSFRFQFPSDFVKFVHLERLDVSSNKLVGPIPSTLFSLPSIMYLNLSNNRFSGELPTNLSCNINLGIVDVSNNLLIGKLPSCLESNSTNRTVISSWNCLANVTTKYQHTYNFCRKEAVAVLPPKGNNQNKKGDKPLKLGLVLGIIGAIVGIAGLIGVLILGTYRRSKAKTATKYESNSFDVNKNTNFEDGRRTQAMRMSSLGLPPYNIFTQEEIEDATNNFALSNLVEEGSQVQIYKGCLRDGSMVVVKCLKLKQKHSPQTLQQQMDAISKLRHRHLVSVLGHCVVTYTDRPNSVTNIYLVLENVSNGSLRDHLADWRKKQVLKWPHRMGITLGIARGIKFLHTETPNGIYGNDLKIETVLLDDNLTAKIGSYNISSPSKHPDAESLQNRQVTSKFCQRVGNPEKEDIYRFGVIVLQLITGELINSEDEIDELKKRVETGLRESPARLRETTDPSIRGTFAYESLKTAVEIAMRCVDEDPRSRPSMEDVVWNMQYSVQVQEGWNSSENLHTKF